MLKKKNSIIFIHTNQSPSFYTATMNLFGLAFAVSQVGNLVSAPDPIMKWTVVRLCMYHLSLYHVEINNKTRLIIVH